MAFLGPTHDPARYRVEPGEQVGAEGEVLKGWREDGSIDGPVAIKVTHPDPDGAILAVARSTWPDQVTQLRRMRGAPRGLVRVIEQFEGIRPAIGERDGGDRAMFLVMEWVEGPSLSGMLRASDDGTTDPAVLRDAAEALDALHAAGLLHCDVKLANVKVALDRFREPYTVLVDFGLMREQINDHTASLKGTHGYFDPAVTLNNTYSRRSDLYAFVSTAARCITGQWARSTITDVLAEIDRRVSSGPARRFVHDSFDPSVTKRPPETTAVAWLDRFLTLLAGDAEVHTSAIAVSEALSERIVPDSDPEPPAPVDEGPPTEAAPPEPTPVDAGPPTEAAPSEPTPVDVGPPPERVAGDGGGPPTEAAPPDPRPIDDGPPTEAAPPPVERDPLPPEPTPVDRGVTSELPPPDPTPVPPQREPAPPDPTPVDRAVTPDPPPPDPTPVPPQRDAMPPDPTPVDRAVTPEPPPPEPRPSQRDPSPPVPPRPGADHVRIDADPPTAKMDEPTPDPADRLDPTGIIDGGTSVLSQGPETKGAGRLRTDNAAAGFMRVFYDWLLQSSNAVVFLVAAVIAGFVLGVLVGISIL